MDLRCIRVWQIKKRWGFGGGIWSAKSDTKNYAEEEAHRKWNIAQKFLFVSVYFLLVGCPSTNILKGIANARFETIGVWNFGQIAFYKVIVMQILL